MNKCRVRTYPNKPLGEQKRPFGESFSGFQLLKDTFGKREGYVD